MPRPRSDISERIVHAARARFLAEGVDGASLRQISRDAGTNVGMVYYYFPTKDDLFLAVVEEVYGNLVRDLGEAMSPDKPFDERVRGIYQRMAAMSDDEFTVIRIVIREAMVSSQRLGRVLQRFREGHVGYVIDLLIEGYGTGRVRQDIAPETLLPCLAGLAMGLVLSKRMGDAVREGSADPPWPPADPREVAKTAASLVLRGAAPDK